MRTELLRWDQFIIKGTLECSLIPSGQVRIWGEGGHL